MPNSSHQSFDQSRREENQKTTLDRVVCLQDMVSVKIEADESVRLRGITLDITEHKQAEDELRRISERLRLATGAASIGIERC
jgi:PAS domain-containing protein